MNEKIKTIADRCSKVNLITKGYFYKRDNENDDEAEEGNDEPKEIQGLIVQIPEERDSKNIIILDDSEIDKVIESNFEKFKFIKGYEAVWSPELGIVEGEIQSDDVFRGNMILRRIQRFFKKNKEQEDEENSETTSFEFPSPKEGVRIIIGLSSRDYSILTSLSREYFFLSSRIRPRPTIRIEGLTLSSHDQAKNFLANISNSVFFQIDLAVNIPLHLTIDRELFKDIRMRRRAIQENVDFKPPKYQYDQEPLSLYWYARTARNMPLLQFLAFYQVLEFYFPHYSYMEAQQRIKNYLKDPTFDADRESDISQILDIIKVTSKGKSFGDEKDQLKATVLNCIDKVAMIKYLMENEERKDFFDIHKKNKGLAKHKISFSNTDHDTRVDVSLRIYEIRCRIVHTKDESELDLLLPFAPEVKSIKHDLELVEFLARQAIIASGRQISLNN